MSNAVQEAAAGVVGDLAAEAEQNAPSEPEAAVAEAPQETAPLAFDPDPELPEDITELLDEPDFEEEAAAEIAAAIPEDEYNTEAYTDPELAEERRKRIAAEKRAAHFEGLRVKDSRSKWEAEAAKFFPFADAGSIQATSRRGFLRAAQQENERVKNLPSIKAMIERGSLATEAVAAEALDIAREESRDAWGKPLVGPSAAPAAAIQKQDQAQRIQNARTVHDRIRLRLQGTDALGLIPREGGER